MRYLTVNLVLEFIALSLLVTKNDSYINAKNIDETCDEITMPSLSAILQGKYLDGYVFGNIPALDKNFCLIQCLHQRQCKSVNYEEDTSLCYLNNEDHNSQPLSLKVTIDSKQYYPVDSVNEVLLGRCIGHNCIDDTICKPLPYGFNNPYECVTSDLTFTPTASFTQPDPTVSVTPSDQTVSTTPSDSTVSVTPSDQTVSITPSDQTVSVIPSDQTVSITPSDQTVSVTPSDQTVSITPSDPTVTPTVCTLTDGCINCMPTQFVFGNITYRPIGCVHGGGIHPLPNLQNNFRSLINWSNLQLTVEQCVTEAYSSGFPYCGIEFWAECWVSHTFDITSFSLVVGSECETQCYSGVAAANKQFIYEIL